MNGEEIDSAVEQPAFGRIQSVLLNPAGVAVLQKDGQNTNSVLSEDFLFSFLEGGESFNDFRKAGAVWIGWKTLNAAGEIFKNPGVPN